LIANYRLAAADFFLADIVPGAGVAVGTNITLPAPGGKVGHRIEKANILAILANLVQALIGQRAVTRWAAAPSGTGGGNTPITVADFAFLTERTAVSRIAVAGGAYLAVWAGHAHAASIDTEPI